MPKLNGRVPKFCHHKASGKAVVTLNGKDFYLGPYDDPESRSRYDALITRWLANGRRLLPHEEEQPDDTTINELVVAFWEHAQNYYRHPDGSPTTEIENYRQAIRPLVELYGDTAIREFGPLSLKGVRNHMVEMGWARKYINAQVGRIRSLFRWGTEEEWVPGPVYQALTAVKGLRRGRTQAKEIEPIKPVPEAHVKAIQPFVSDTAWAMIQLQLFTGARPGEITQMRYADLDTTGDIWTYTPRQHKTAHHGHSRVIYLGPRHKRSSCPF